MQARVAIQEFFYAVSHLEAVQDVSDVSQNFWRPQMEICRWSDANDDIFLMELLNAL